VVENPIYDFMENSPKDPMVNMHLDTYFNLAGDGIAVGSPELMQKAKLTIYAGGKGNEGDILGKTTLYEFLKSHNYNFIPLSLSEQLAYSSNFLTISDRKIITVNVSSVLERLLKEHVFPDYVEKEVISDLNRRGKDSLFPHNEEIRNHGIDNLPVRLSELTGGYGGAHCMTAALER
jgi:arginine deiminase